MATILRMEPPRGAETARACLGIEVSSDCRRLSAALVLARGQAVDLQAEILEGATVAAPGEAALRFDRLSDSSAEMAATEAAEALGGLRASLAEAEALLASAVLAQAGVSPGRVLALGVQDPGLWSFGPNSPGAYLGLCDAARLAELTGMNVVDAFPARDVARGGQGGPLVPLAEWVLLRHPTFHRLVIDLGRTTRMTYLPRQLDGQATWPLLSFEVGPGMRLVDFFAHRFSNGEHAFDPGGRFAVQGQRLELLVAHWRTDPYFRRPLPRWHPRGVRVERFLVDAMKMAVEQGWSIRDLLCTATHFVADAIALAAARQLPEGVKIDEIVLTGGGQQNGLLLREIAARFPKIPITPIGELGMQSDAFGPACAALLAFFHIDQAPANRQEITGVELARVLGRLTPGSPQSWQRLLAEMGASRPAVRSLRSAL